MSRKSQRQAMPASQSCQSAATIPPRRSQRVTKPQAADEAAPAQPQVADEVGPASQSTAQDSTVRLNWTLFDDKSHRLPFFSNIPRDLYEDASQECQQLFVGELLRRHRVATKAEGIMFWTPKKPLSFREAGAKGWAASVNEFEEHFLPVQPLEAFSELPTADRNHIHLVITVREVDDVVLELNEFKRYHNTVLTPGATPSEGAKSSGYRKIQADNAQAIYDGRRAPHGLSTVAPPIQIFHPIFDDFINLVNDPGVQPTSDDLKQVQELMHYVAEVGRVDEGNGGYNAGLRKRLRNILQADVHEEPNSDGTMADGVVILQLRDAHIASLILEWKRELGEGDCDPSLQVGLSMKRSWIDPSRGAIREKCCCPTLLVAGGGPWLSVMGGVFTDKFIVQRLTDMRWNALSSTEEDSRIYHNARVFIALRQCLVKLQDFYEGIQDVPPLVQNQPHPRYFPYPTSFTARDNNSLTRFRYLASLETDDACVTYLAEIIDDAGVAGDRVVVKFVARYGEEVHEFLAHHGYAPALRYCGPLPGTKFSGIPPGPARSATPGLLSLRSDLMHMVVMDYIDAQRNSPPDVREQIEKILTLLHSEGYVFGDLQRQNILFDADGKVKLVDFNWCGRYNMRLRDEGLPGGLQNEIDKNVNRIQVRDGPYAYYPLSMSMAPPNMPSMWVDGMGPLMQIRPQHDWGMFGKLLL
ncbi:hypothetical protein M413DRAFT_442362 [Hebeloma cylindrosporum]|uniref:Protein kinase domain-containing protein n=1 Tax=Hebeloma cylindrosporum TaxID=76867 RepID=A0A0C2YXR8_HEBCY|nr:hypothetical protein M413DRAFT_442362 [Hebeloma cylindrosporum h7]